MAFKNMKASLWILLILQSFYHDFYISICYIKVVDEYLEIDYRVFKNDAEVAMMTTGDLPSDDFCLRISSYIQKNFHIIIDGIPLIVKLVDCKNEGIGQLETVACRLISDQPFLNAREVKISSTVLLESFDDQVNMIHFQMGNLKKSMNLDHDRKEFSLLLN